MQRIRRFTLSALLIAASVGISATPATAEDSAWGSYDYPIVLHPGGSATVGVFAAIAVGPVSRYQASRAAAPADQPRLGAEFVAAVFGCLGDPAIAASVLNRLGIRQSTPIPPTLPPGAAFTVRRTARTEPHWVRVSCTQGHTTPAYVSACVRFDIDPARAIEFYADTDTPTLDLESPRRDPCPSPARILADSVTDIVIRVITPRFLNTIPPGFQGPGASTTTTTRRPGSPSGGGGGGGGSADTTAPVVSSVSLGGSTYCQPVNVGASVADAVGVTSATVTWSGPPGSGSMAMSGGGSSWSAVISPPAGFLAPGTLNVTVTVRDAAGNQATGSSSIELTLC